MTDQEAITIIGNLEDKDILFNPCDVQDAKTMAIKALTAIEDIKAELLKGYVDDNPKAYEYTIVPLKEVLEIIDKHTKGEK